VTILLELKTVAFEERLTGSVVGDVAVFHYNISGEGVERGTIEIVVPWAVNLGNAQQDAESKLKHFSGELAKSVGHTLVP